VAAGLCVRIHVCVRMDVFRCMYACICACSACVHAGTLQIMTIFVFFVIATDFFDFYEFL
jgi:hypothetical protein